MKKLISKQGTEGLNLAPRALAVRRPRKFTGVFVVVDSWKIILMMMVVMRLCLRV